MDNSFVLCIDFVTDIITNSSSVVYTSVSTPDRLHDAIDEILSYFDATKKSRDVFSIESMPDFEYHIESIVERPDDYDAILDIKYPDGFDNYSWEEKEDVVEKYLKEAWKVGEIDDSFFEEVYPYRMESHYVVITKNKKHTQLGNIVRSLFYHESHCQCQQ